MVSEHPRGPDVSRAVRAVGATASPADVHTALELPGVAWAEADALLVTHYPHGRPWRLRLRPPFLARLSPRYCGWCGGTWPCERYRWARAERASR